MNGRRGDGEEALHIGLGRWLVHDERIGVDEGQVLALFICEGWILGRVAHVRKD